ncbi:MAG TPA: TIGR02266 family protein [Aggregicoccus sp.]|nr:TIGR02266 family protein [Aggregicoccus sp.]
MTEKTETPQAAQRAPRLQHELMVAYRAPGSPVFSTHWAVNLSGGGMFINTSSPLPVNSPLELVLSLPDGAPPLELSGRVARVSAADKPEHHPAGMGIEFVDVDDDKRSRVERFVTRLRQALPELSGGPAGEAKK